MRNGWRVLVVTALVCMPGLTAAQQIDDTAVAQRSRQIQAQLRAIDADRAGFASRLFTEWSPFLDNSKYDLQNELRSIIMRAPAWQLYGASLVGDFKTMLQVLRGVRPAGPYIEALTTPEAKTSLGTAGFPPAAAALDTPEAPLAFGATTDQLVYTPIAPCRIADTRETGARTGIIPAGSTRTFDLTTTAFAKGQGGATSCTGLPSFSYLGWAVNITVTGYSGFGWLTAWGATDPETFTSIINYSASISPAIANGLTLRGCYGCADDITIRASGSATHVIIDVVGYFSEPTLSGSTVARFAGTPVSIATGSFAFVTGAACPAGTLLIGGEVDHGSGDLAVGEYHQSGTTQWTFWMINNSGGTGNVTAYSRCLDRPVKLP